MIKRLRARWLQWCAAWIATTVATFGWAAVVTDAPADVVLGVVTSTAIVALVASVLGGLVFLGLVHGLQALVKSPPPFFCVLLGAIAGLSVALLPIRVRVGNVVESLVFFAICGALAALVVTRGTGRVSRAPT